VSLAHDDVVPHIIIQSSRLRPGEFEIHTAKRLLQHYPPKATETLLCSEMSLRAMCGRPRVGKKNLHFATVVGAAMCSAFECGTQDRWP
jgi:hypothetical protein